MTTRYKKVQTQLRGARSESRVLHVIPAQGTTKAVGRPPEPPPTTVETVTDFIFGGSKITVDVDFSYEIKRHLLFGRKAKTNLDSIFKSRDFTLPTKVHLVKPVIFPAVMYGCESWTTKKAEH